MLVVRSVQTDERLQELVYEAGECECDALMVNETLRESGEELLKLEARHTYMGSGGTFGQHSVRVLLHRHWSNK